MSEFKELIGKTITRIDGKKGDDELIFLTSDNKKYMMWHDQDYCERVYLEDVCGDFEDIIGSPVLKACESTNNENPEGVKMYYQDSFTWTFYHISTAKGTVTLRWYGESNGCYSEGVDFDEIKGDN